MRKYLLIFVFFVSLPLAAQQADEPEQPVQTVSKSSLTAKHVDSKLNEVTLHKTVLDYSLPPEIEEAARTCTQGQEDCYFTFKTFENSAEPQVAGAANLELAVLSLQRGLVKQALTHIEKAGQLAPDDPFIELTHGWMLLSAGKYKKARETFDHLLYLSADHNQT